MRLEHQSAVASRHPALGAHNSRRRGVSNPCSSTVISLGQRPSFPARSVAASASLMSHIVNGCKTCSDCSWLPPPSPFSHPPLKDNIEEVNKMKKFAPEGTVRLVLTRQLLLCCFNSLVLAPRAIMLPAAELLWNRSNGSRTF